MTTETGSDHPKYESYKEARARIAAARQGRFFLEAIAIEESIITALDNEFPEKFTIGDIKDTAQDLNDLKDDRNRAIHAFVKSDPGTPTVDIQEFLLMAVKAAEQGATQQVSYA